MERNAPSITTLNSSIVKAYPKVGDVVNVKYDPKSLEVELDLTHDDRYDLKGFKHKQQAEHQAALRPVFR